MPGKSASCRARAPAPRINANMGHLARCLRTPSYMDLSRWESQHLSAVVIHGEQRASGSNQGSGYYPLWAASGFRPSALVPGCQVKAAFDDSERIG